MRACCPPFAARRTDLGFSMLRFRSAKVPAAGDLVFPDATAAERLNDFEAKVDVTGADPPLAFRSPTVPSGSTTVL